MMDTWYRFEVMESVKYYLFDDAKEDVTVRDVRGVLDKIMTDLDSRGTRFYTLLFYRLARYGLEKMQRHPPDLPDFMDIVKTFTDQWDSDPELRNAKVLAEHL